MSKSVLYDNGNGGLGLQVVFDDRGAPFALGIFTRTFSGQDRVLTGTLVPGSVDADGASFELTRGLGVDVDNGEWPRPPERRVPCGRANLTRLGSGWQLVLSELNLGAGEIQPSPPAPLIYSTQRMSPLTA